MKTNTMRLVMTGAAFAATLGFGTAYAANCGDDVDGARVPCACGDQVNSDTTLQATDPVVANGPCKSFGLKIKGGDKILDCDGLLVEGTGKSTGLSAGSEFNTITNCVVKNFVTGIQVSGKGEHEVSNNISLDNKKWGIRILANQTTADNNVAVGNGDVGIEIGKKQDFGSFSENIAVKNGIGINFKTVKGIFATDNLSTANAGDGFTGKVEATPGVDAFGSDVSNNKSLGNDGAGFNIEGGKKGEPNSYSDNSAVGNGGVGLVVTNDAAFNVDDGGNSGAANSADPQCEIGGADCN